ncbi:hypothetical protein ZWY2020_004834 [Hordeum vulgare]|nr:hypothetical protein ZWY2020_004834 [Hordeum vulgare]
MPGEAVQVPIDGGARRGRPRPWRRHAGTEGAKGAGRGRRQRIVEQDDGGHEPDFLRTGNTSFLVIYQHSDYAFGLFAGGKDNTKLLADSNKISFKNPEAPAFPRLS